MRKTNETFKDRRVITRIWHDCDWCGETIVKGRLCFVIEWREKEKFMRKRMHVNCYNEYKDQNEPKYKSGSQLRPERGW